MISSRTNNLVDKIVQSDREIGELTGRMAAMERTTERLERKLDANSDQTAEILKRIAGLDGGWRVLIAAAALVSAAVGLLIKFLPFFVHA